MSKYKFLIVLLCMLLLAINSPAYAQSDDTPTPEGGVVATVEATEASTTEVIVVPEVTEAPTLEVTVEPTDELTPDDIAELSPVFATYQTVILIGGGIVLTVLTVVMVIVVALIKSNATLAKYAAENVSQGTLNSLIEGLGVGKSLAEQLTPKWEADDRVFGGIQDQIVQLRDLLLTSLPPEAKAQVNIPPKTTDPNALHLQLAELRQLAYLAGVTGNKAAVPPVADDPNAVG